MSLRRLQTLGFPQLSICLGLLLLLHGDSQLGDLTFETIDRSNGQITLDRDQLGGGRVCRQLLLQRSDFHLDCLPASMELRTPGQPQDC